MINGIKCGENVNYSLWQKNRKTEYIVIAKELMMRKHNPMRYEINVN